jgi:hypothetical protein
LAKTFAITTPTTAKGPSAFFVRLHQSVGGGEDIGGASDALSGEFSTPQH